MFKRKPSGTPSLFRSGGEQAPKSITFFVPDNKASKADSSALSKIRMPSDPGFKTLGDAHAIGVLLLKKFHPRNISIVAKPGMSSEEVYKANEKTLRDQISERDAIALIIDKMINPMIGVVATDHAELKKQSRNLEELEDRVRDLEHMIKALTGTAPQIPALPSGKTVWRSTLKDAADAVVTSYSKDSKESTRSGLKNHYLGLVL